MTRSTGGRLRYERADEQQVPVTVRRGQCGQACHRGTDARATSAPTERQRKAGRTDRQAHKRPTRHVPIPSLCPGLMPPTALLLKTSGSLSFLQKR